METYFADSSFWIALSSRRDQHHSRAVEWHELVVRSRSKVLTTEAVLWEWLNALSDASTRGVAVEGYRRAHADVSVEVVPFQPGLADAAVTLYAARSDEGWSLRGSLASRLVAGGAVFLKQRRGVGIVSGESHGGPISSRQLSFIVVEPPRPVGAGRQHIARGMLRTVKTSRWNDHVDRRHFVAAATAGFATQLALVSEEAAAQTRPLPPDSGLLKGFEAKWVRTNGADIFLRHGGEGPPLLLLHGNPQTHVCFHKIAETLAKRFHVVAADLRGYGDSVGPTEGGKNHENYSFRAMAQDQADVMAALGYDRFFVAGQDRGARAAHRMALDHKERVRKVALLDILPTRYVWANTSRDWALNSWHWVFMAQPDEMFERMIAAIPAREFILRHLGRSGKPAFFDDRAVAEYVRCFTPKTIHGSCEDYRAAAGIDLTHDEEDHKAGNRIVAPVLALWGSRSHTGRFYGGDLLSIWRAEADNVSGGALDSGHYLVEEAPLAVLAAFDRFFV